ncbi:hypothetical protein HPP92_003597 [Vanilla planifolia]|uniref:Uncharacterized protein n=1 Tax=Vanilla planifolia TaxID=51239 RepID=A0A835S3A4_VANPL|nr:hypothetical protein HPP92_003597 [Vanilla planifolia]
MLNVSNTPRVSQHSVLHADAELSWHSATGCLRKRLRELWPTADICCPSRGFLTRFEEGGALPVDQISKNGCRIECKIAIAFGTR